MGDWPILYLHIKKRANLFVLVYTFLIVKSSENYKYCGHLFRNYELRFTAGADLQSMPFLRSGCIPARTKLRMKKHFFKIFDVLLGNIHLFTLVVDGKQINV